MHSSFRSTGTGKLGKNQAFANQTHPYEKTLQPSQGLKPYTIVILMSIVLATVAVFFIFPDNALIKSAATRLGSLLGKEPSAILSPPAAKLQQLIKRISEDNHWNSKRINLIVYNWGSLNSAQKQQMQQTRWFSGFVTLLVEKVSELDSLKPFNLDADSTNRDLIRTLAIIIDATNQNNSRNQAGQNQIAFANRFDNSKTATAVRKPINRANDTHQERHTDSNSGTSTQQTESDNVIKESESKQSRANRMEGVLFSKIDLESITPDVTIEKAKKTKRSKRERSWKKRPAELRFQPTIAELYNVVNRYTTAYEQGNVKNILSLFSNDAKTNTKNTLDGIRQDYHALFSNTSDRQIFIQDLNWSYSKNYAKGVGSIKTMLLSEVNSEVKTSSGKIQFIARKINGEILITHLFTTETFD